MVVHIPLGFQASEATYAQLQPQLQAFFFALIQRQRVISHGPNTAGDGPYNVTLSGHSPLQLVQCPYISTQCNYDITLER